MAEQAVPQEYSSDPGELARVYEEYLDSLTESLVMFVHGSPAA